MITKRYIESPFTVTLTDLETTGLDENTCIPIQIAAIKLEHNPKDSLEITKVMTLEFKLQIPPEHMAAADAAKQYNSYDPQVWAKEGVSRIEAYSEYLGELENSCFGGQNPAFDKRFLDADFKRRGIRWPKMRYYGLVSVDTMARPLQLRGFVSSLKQQEISGFFKLGVQTHDALDDILQSAEVYRRLHWLEIKGFSDSNIQQAVDMPSEFYTPKQ